MENQLIGLMEKLQETPIEIMGKSGWFPVDFPLNQSTERIEQIFGQFWDRGFYVFLKSETRKVREGKGDYRTRT